jgi:LysR family transcriptional regulator, glycine cleavage system transcriptional activator
VSTYVRNILPSMTGLRAFEASARHRSFTRAAIELNLTQSAVSHQIRKLEDLLGTKLFDRIGNEVQVTATGAEFYSVARVTISELRSATDRAARHARDPLLTIGVLGTFAVKCLFPNLNEFISSNPDILLRFRILRPSPDVSLDDCDFAILYGSGGDWPELEATRITSEELFPVCSVSAGRADRARLSWRSGSAHNHSDQLAADIARRLAVLASPSRHCGHAVF